MVKNGHPIDTNKPPTDLQAPYVRVWHQDSLSLLRSINDHPLPHTPQRTINMTAFKALNLVGSNGRCYRLKKLIQERPHFGRVWLASFDPPPMLFYDKIISSCVDLERINSYWKTYLKAFSRPSMRTFDQDLLKLPVYDFRWTPSQISAYLYTNTWMMIS